MILLHWTHTGLPLGTPCEDTLMLLPVSGAVFFLQRDSGCLHCLFTPAEDLGCHLQQACGTAAC